MDENLLRLQNTVRALFLEAGGKPPAIPSVTPYRFTTTAVEMPHIDEPYLYLVLDGVLRLHTPSGIMDYMAGQYSLSKIDTPFSGTVLAFSGHQDLLAVSLTFTPSEVIETVLGLDDELMERILSGQLSEEETAASDSAVLEAVNRLFSAAEHTVPSAFLRKNIMQEIAYYVLCGSCGKQFIQSISNIRQADEIYQANSWIKKNFRESFAVEDLAEQQRMSVSLFHRKFKSAVGMGPLQCQKRLRLTEARRLMLDEGKNVTEASVEVGYESLSQFIRDYGKMFGSTPKDDILNLQKQWKE